MGLSYKQRLALLPPDQRKAIVASLPDEIIDEMNRGEWWYVSRPEQVPPPGDWMICLALAGRGFGKGVPFWESIPVAYTEDMLPHNTPLAARGGFKKMGDIQVGDTVFDETGKPCKVTAVWDRLPPTAYRFTFSDGVTVDSCDEHQWVTWTHADRKAFLRSEYIDDKTRFPEDWPNWRAGRRGRGTVVKYPPNAPGPRIKTSKDIAETVTYNQRGDLNHCIPVAGDIQTPPVRLILDPWLLGFWLGNGYSGGGTISGNVMDLPHVTSKLLESGFRMNPQVIRGGFTGTPYSLVKLLRELGVLDNKHVPSRYLWAPPGDRRNLLAGLLDSDGYIDPKNSHVEFSSTNRILADAVVHLARSLGQKPVLAEGRAVLNGQDTGPKFRVTWRPTFNPFSSPRKRSAYREPARQALRNQHRMITKVEESEPEPIRCITVNSPNSMYLATEAFIPTHNSRCSSEWIVDQVVKHPFDRQGNPTEWLVVADTLSDARTINADGPSGIKNVLNRRRIDHRYKQSPRPMFLFPDGAKIYLEGADSPDTGRGYNAAGAVCDEIAKWLRPSETWYEGLLPSLRADLIDDHPRAFVTTTPKPIPLLQEWLKRDDHTIHVITGSTFDNASNLSAPVLAELRRRYDGTSLGEQELYGKLLELAGGGLFQRMDIVDGRAETIDGDVVSTVVGVDPNLTGDDAETGIVVVSRTADDHLWVLDDATIMGTGRVAALHMWRTMARWGADLLVYETNLGKRWMQEVLTDAYVELRDEGLFPRGTTPPMKGVDSKHGKKTRAEPVAMRYEQRRVHHVGIFEQLENQMVLFDPESTRESPDRMDALVHACRHLMAGEKKRMRISDPSLYQLGLGQDLYDLSRLLGT